MPTATMAASAAMAASATMAASEASVGATAACAVRLRVRPWCSRVTTWRCTIRTRRGIASIAVVGRRIVGTPTAVGTGWPVGSIASRSAGISTPRPGRTIRRHAPRGIHCIVRTIGAKSPRRAPRVRGVALRAPGTHGTAGTSSRPRLRRVRRTAGRQLRLTAAVQSTRSAHGVSIRGGRTV